MKQENQIGLKEYIAMAIFLMGLKAGDDLPAILFDSMDNAGWMGPIIGGFIAILPIYLLLNLVQKYEGKTAIDIFCHVFGKHLGLFVLFLLWAVGFLYIVLDTAVYTDIISSMYFIRTPTIVLYVTLLGVSAYAAKRGLAQIGSASWIALPYLQVALLLAIVIMLIQGNRDFLFPLLGRGTGEVLKEGVWSVSLYMDFLYLFLLFPYVKSTKDFKKGSWIAFFLIICNIAISMVSYVMLFDFYSVKMLNYLFHEAIRTVSFGFLTGIETFIFPFWLIAANIKFAIYLYISTFLFGQLFKIKHFEYLIPAFTTLIVFLGLLPESPTFTVHQITEWIGYIFTPVFFFLPIILWVITKWKGEMK